MNKGFGTEAVEAPSVEDAGPGRGRAGEETEKLRFREDNLIEAPLGGVPPPFVFEIGS